MAGWGPSRRVGLVCASVAAVHGAAAMFERVAPRRHVRRFQRFANRFQRPAAGLLPGWAVIETTGRRTGLPRQTPVGGRLRGDTYWLVAGDGHHSSYVHNIAADPRVRLRVHGRWRAGTAHPLPEDDARRRLRSLNPANSLFVRIASRPADMLTIRIDLAPARGAQAFLISR